MTFERSDGIAEVEMELNAETSAEAITTKAQLKVTWNGDLFGERHWDCVVPRALSAPDTS